MGVSGSGTGQAATSTAFIAQHVAVGPDGTVYVASLREVARVTPDGRLVRVAGGGTSSADNVPALAQQAVEGLPEVPLSVANR